MEIKRVGVVGCGLMGSGITQICAQSGYQVVVSEINKELLNKGLDSISLFLTRNVKKGRLTEEEKEVTLARIKGTTDLSGFNDCDLVIEAAVENMDIKKKLFAELDMICPKHAILASNTSCLSIIDMATVTSRPENVLGIHFFNPVPLMNLVEIVKTIATSDAVLKSAEDFGGSLEKTTIIAPDTPGFIVNRLLVPLLLGAFRMLETGGATREDIDAGVKLGLGHPMGPLTLADLIGIDTILYIANAIFDELKDPLYAPPVILKKMVSVGWLGRKTGKGFYEYK
ncbi:3-hydroxyacyl-CoA dehydrogenase family protein [Chloroflexota bacterium]